MKNFYDVWKKYILEEDVKTATDAVNQASKNKNAVICHSFLSKKYGRRGSNI